MKKVIKVGEKENVFLREHFFFFFIRRRRGSGVDGGGGVGRAICVHAQAHILFLFSALVIFILYIW